MTPTVDAKPNPRERIGGLMRRTTASLIGAPLTLVLLVGYLRHTRAGHRDRWASLSYASVAIAMAVMPLWILVLLSFLL